VAGATLLVHRGRDAGVRREFAKAMMRTLFLQAPSYDGFDGGAGARYQMRREVRSFWYPTWLAQPAALVEGSKLIDAPPHRLTFEDVAPEALARDLIVLHTSTPSFASDVKTVEALKARKPSLKIGMIGAKVAVEPEASLKASRAIDFVARNEFDLTIKEVAEGRDLADIAGLSWRKADGTIVSNDDRAILENMDDLPFVTPVYKRDLVIENYFGGYLKHPYISFYTGRGCKSRCSFCLWPQTIGGHRYRTRSVGHVIEELVWARKAFPQVKEFFFDDDTLTDNVPRVEALACEIGKLGITWSCNAKANVPRDTLKVMKDNGLRLLLVGYESGNQKILHNIKKGMRVDVARRFTKDCHEFGIVIHGTFILGLPGETKETIEETIRFATEVNPHTIQISLAAPYPGTLLYKQALTNGWLVDEQSKLLTDLGTQEAALSYPHLSHTEIFESVEDFYRRFYFRAPKIASIVGEMIRSPEMLKRRLREGLEFFRFLREREVAL
jgi:hopanoid biosynthesis associated radical SAM protein HpnJ